MEEKNTKSIHQCLKEKAIDQLLKKQTDFEYWQEEQKRWQKEQNGSIKRTEKKVDQLDKKLEGKLDIIYNQLIKTSQELGSIQGEKERVNITKNLMLQTSHNNIARYALWTTIAIFFITSVFNFLNTLGIF